MAKRKKKKSTLPGNRHAFIKLYPNRDCAEIFVVTTKNLKKAYGPISDMVTYSGDMERRGIVAVGRVYYSSCGTYYGTDTKVQDKLVGQGHGDYLYKAMLIATKLLAKARRRAKIFFSPHEYVGSSTSNAAWRCYKALARKGYLQKENSRYEVIKLPRCISHTVLQMEAS